MNGARALWRLRLWLVIGPVRLYQIAVGPLLPRSCRFEPSCSRYAIEAVERFGLFKGAFAAFWRILRCNPYGRCGHDPVEAFRWPLTGRLAAKRSGGTQESPASKLCADGPGNDRGRPETSVSDISKSNREEKKN